MDDELRRLRAELSAASEFASAGAPGDADSAGTHVRALELLEHVGIDATEDVYAAATDLPGGGLVPVDRELDGRLEAAAALHDLAMFDLRQRGLADDEQAYLERMAELERETGLDYDA